MSGWDKNKSDYSGGVWPWWKYIPVVIIYLAIPALFLWLSIR